MSDSNYFDKFVKDLDERSEKKSKTEAISEQEQRYQEQRRLRVRMYQERWQNRIIYRGVINGKK
jgi:hypothetical protein